MHLVDEVFDNVAIAVEGSRRVRLNEANNVRSDLRKFLKRMIII